MVSMINVVSLLNSSHIILLNTLDGMQTSEWEHPNICGSWSGRNVLAHLGSFELMMVELLKLGRVEDGEAGRLDQFVLDRHGFNSAEIKHRHSWTLAAIYCEYEQAHEQVKQLATPIVLAGPTPHHGLRRYGSSMAESLITLGYGHKLAHAAQIAAFRDRRLRSLSATPSPPIFDML